MSNDRATEFTKRLFEGIKEENPFLKFAQMLESKLANDYNVPLNDINVLIKNWAAVGNLDLEQISNEQRDTEVATVAALISVLYDYYLTSCNDITLDAFCKDLKFTVLRGSGTGTKSDDFC